MNDLTQQIIEELEAFDPHWRNNYPNVRSAAKAAGVLDLFNSWIKSPVGALYLDSCGSLPDYAGAAKREAEALAKPSSLPFGLNNLGVAAASPEERAEFENRFRPEENA